VFIRGEPFEHDPGTPTSLGGAGDEIVEILGGAGES
jgi:hypothetical protein